MNMHAVTEYRNAAIARSLDRAALIDERNRIMRELKEATNDNLRTLRQNQLRDVNMRIAAM